jgi:hypothetical protein
LGCVHQVLRSGRLRDQLHEGRAGPCELRIILNVRLFVLRRHGLAVKHHVALDFVGPLKRGLELRIKVIVVCATLELRLRLERLQLREQRRLRRVRRV